MAETAELDTTQEAPPTNGHGYQSFDDDQALLSHILSKKPAEQLVDVPEWGVQILCRALSAKSRVEIQLAAYDKESKRADFRKVMDLVVIAGCFNPATGKPVFTESHRAALALADGGAIERLALTILRLSRMLSDDADSAKKN